jgi:hypothetical protein
MDNNNYENKLSLRDNWKKQISKQKLIILKLGTRMLLLERAFIATNSHELLYSCIINIK